MDSAAQSERIGSLVTAVASTMIAHADELTALDQAIGDGDHGLNMKRGFQAVLADVNDIAELPFSEALKAIGTKLVMTVGGASGPLYGSLFLGLSKSFPEHPTRANLAPAFRAAVDSVALRGKSVLGQKTMLDVLYPALDAFISGTLADVANAANTAANATSPMKAIRGRASFLGDRSIGHIDPGARSSAILISAIVTFLGETA